MADRIRDILNLGWQLSLTTNNEREERYIFEKSFSLDDEDPDAVIVREVDINCDKKLKSTELFLRISEPFAARYLTMPEMDAFYSFMKEIDDELYKN